MPLKIQVKNIDKEIKSIKKERDKITQKEITKVGLQMRSQLSAATPVDTGLARDSWTLTILPGTAIVRNNVPYIDKLNQGSSKQAPSFFVETVALRFGKPVGVIVTKTP